MEPSFKKSENQSLQTRINLLEKSSSDLQASLATLRASEEKYRRLFETDPDAIIVFDADSLYIEDVNAAAHQLFGFSELEFKNLPFDTLCALKEQTLSEMIRIINRGAKEKQILRGHFKRKDETSFPGAFYYGSFTSISGKKLFAAIREITEKLKTEELLRKSQEQLFQAQKMEALGTLVAGVAHEINNPINLVMYNIPLIKRIWNDFKPVMAANAEKHPNLKYGGLTYGFIKENLDQLIEDMDMAAKRVETIVRRLKDFSRKSSIQEKLDISVNEAVENALRLSQSTLKKSKVTINSALSEDIPLIKGHLQSIEQVVLNLIVNAIEAIDHDHGEIFLRTTFLRTEKAVIIQVQDNGKGMAPETLEKIFDPFFTEKQADGGTGLGLSVSFSLIKSHAGDITCRSEPGKETVFEIRLPLEPSRKPVKVLIVDDDSAFRKLLSQVLKRAGHYSVEMSSNGTEALIKLGTYLPDLLILDLFMPQMNGLEVCRAIVQVKKLDQMKVIIITGLPDSPEIAEIKKIGFMNIFSKPLEINQFVKDVTGMFQKDWF